MAGNALSSLPSSTGWSSMPCCSNTVYSTLDIPYEYSLSPVFESIDSRSTKTFTPSLAPKCRSQLANPSALSSRAPTPANANMVVSVPAIGLVICRTVAPFRPLASSQVKTPWSCISFHMAPWPPGFSETAKSPPPSVTHRPPSVVTTGTSGCSNSRNELSPLPK